MSTRPETNLAAIIANRAETMPDRDVLTVEGAGVRPDEVRTYRALWEQGRRLAQVLIEQGMRPGDRFALLMANHAEFVDAMVAAAISGTVFVPLDPRVKGDKLTFMLDNAQCKGVIAADYSLDNLLAVRESLPRLSWVIGLETGEVAHSRIGTHGVLSYRDALPPQVPKLEIAANDPNGAMQLIFTSGTTGDPKGIVMTHLRFCATAAAVPAMLGYQADERPYSGLSLTHANAQVLTLGASLATGMRAVMSRRFTKSRLWDITRKYGCTTFTLLGGMTTAIYSEPRQPNDAANPVRFVVSAGMPAAIWKAFESRFNVGVVEFYGAAEGGLTVKPLGVGPVGSIGKPVSNLRHRIVDENGNDCTAGVPGELLFQGVDGAPATVEYFGNPEASAKKCKDGWLHMGDIVHADEDGWLYFDCRKGGGIRHNGEFINTAPIEKVIAELSDVADVYVYGVKAASGAPGEKDMVAAVVPTQIDTFDPQLVFRTCREKLDSSSVMSWVQVLDEIPKTASEKPVDRFLIQMFEERRNKVFSEVR
ncbi:class I adenylate-forming enzyme family protein [Paraburkholderia sp.]|uniref:class I adenylate-forming enzyme family protein n=1 Tax=Paraburkholderia sp. TaxID=1926495 RepID=UPI0025FCB3CB|nr:AMP-binding protein [Paraburkholderia sp.]